MFTAFSQGHCPQCLLNSEKYVDLLTNSDDFGECPNCNLQLRIYVPRLLCEIIQVRGHGDFRVPLDRGAGGMMEAQICFDIDESRGLGRSFISDEEGLREVLAQVKDSRYPVKPFKDPAREEKVRAMRALLGKIAGAVAGTVIANEIRKLNEQLTASNDPDAVAKLLSGAAAGWGIASELLDPK